MGFHWGLPWTSPWPCHGIAKCPSDWPPHGPGYSMGPFIGSRPWPCHGIDLGFLVGHPMGQALPLALYWHHLWPCHGVAWCFLVGTPMSCLVLSGWQSHEPGSSMGLALPHPLPPHTHTNTT